MRYRPDINSCNEATTMFHSTALHDSFDAQVCHVLCINSIMALYQFLLSSERESFFLFSSGTSAAFRWRCASRLDGNGSHLPDSEMIGRSRPRGQRTWPCEPKLLIKPTRESWRHLLTIVKYLLKATLYEGRERDDRMRTRLIGRCHATRKISL